MPRFSTRRSQFREHLNAGACLFPASVFDPMSARIAEEIGYEIGMLAGSTASQTILAAPDAILITLSEFAEQARRITRASALPMMSDADHGYGSALNVKRTVEELEAAGLCGLSIEDTALPEPFASNGQAQITSIDEGVGKMRAAVTAKADPSLVIAGRTSAPLISNMDDCIARVTAYQDAGVDMIFVIGIKTPEQLSRLSDAVSLPLMLGGVPPEMRDATELGRHGVRICLIGHHTTTAAAKAIHDTMRALRDGTAPSELQGQPDAAFMKRVLRAAELDKDRAAFLGANG